MNCSNYIEFLILLIVSLSFILVFKFVFYIEFKKIKFNSYFDYKIFISIYPIYYILCQQIVIFVIFKWYYAIVLFFVSLFINKVVFTKKNENILFVKQYNKVIKIHGKIKNQKDIVFADVRYSPMFGYYIQNSLHEYKWWKVQFSTISFALIAPILKELSVINYDLLSTRFFSNCFDLLMFLGFLAGAYWVGYFGFSIKPLVDGWRKIYFYCYLGVVILMTLLFICIKFGLF